MQLNMKTRYKTHTYHKVEMKKFLLVSFAMLHNDFFNPATILLLNQHFVARAH